MDRRSPVLHGDRCRHRRAARHVLSRYVSARRKVQSLRRIPDYQRKTSTGWQISTAGDRSLVQFSTAERGQAVAHDALRRGNAFPRIWSRAARDYHSREVRTFRRNACPRRFRRSAIANASELGLEQKGARYFRRRLSRSIEENSGRHHPENERRQESDGRRFLSTSVRVRVARPCDARRASGKRRLVLCRHIKPDSRKSFSDDRSEHDLCDLLWSHERLRRRLLRLRLGRRNRRRHGDRVRESQGWLSRQTSRNETAPGDLRARRRARRDDVDRKISRPQTIGRAVLEKDRREGRRQKESAGRPVPGKQITASRIARRRESTPHPCPLPFPTGEDEGEGLALAA